MTCPHCHAENPENANFCEECATKLRQICDCVHRVTHNAKTIADQIIEIYRAYNE